MAYHPVGFTITPKLALLLLTINLTLQLQFTSAISRPRVILQKGDELKYGDLLVSPRRSLADLFEKNWSTYVLCFSNKYLKLSYTDVNSGAPDIWVANPNNPIDETSDPRLLLDDYGNLKILYNTSDYIPIYASNSTQKIIAELVDSDGLVVAEGGEYGQVKRVLWRSFDYPNSVLVSGMKLGFNHRTGHKWSLTAGSFTLGMDPYSKQQLVLWRNGIVYWTSGPLKDTKFSNLKATPGRFHVLFKYYSDESETYFLYAVPKNNRPRTAFSAEPRNRPYIALSSEGYLFGEASVFCDGYNPLFGSGCISGGPKSKVNMKRMLILSAAGGALTILISFYICYALWRKRRIKALEKHKRKLLLDEIGGIEVPSVVNSKWKSPKNERTSHDMHIFSFRSIVMATNNFSVANKVGEGGFGHVYKGKLLDGQEMAIKRLSETSRQGLIEFKNEVKLIAKLQHTNLVKLHGFCMERGERMLIYEYMPNKSLDFHLFDSNKRTLLDWKTRSSIIQGIAQGLAYLHIYSRIKIVHRDLKPSNILLDYEMNPKISDFGMARLFGARESKEITKRVVGTHGYMSPEYAMNGIVSSKIDVFSFGVILLEIVSGQRNHSYCHSDVPYGIIEYAWQLWTEGKALQLMDPTLEDVASKHNEILRCIHIGLLCIQHEAKDRPIMSGVVASLSNENMSLAEPKQPAYIGGNNRPQNPQNEHEIHSINHVTLSTMSAR